MDGQLSFAPMTRIVLDLVHNQWYNVYLVFDWNRVDSQNGQQNDLYSEIMELLGGHKRAYFFATLKMIDNSIQVACFRHIRVRKEGKNEKVLRWKIFNLKYKNRGVLDVESQEFKIWTK